MALTHDAVAMRHTCTDAYILTQDPKMDAFSS